jgi:orotidine-5'-phosphate decarboxylase
LERRWYIVLATSIDQWVGYLGKGIGGGDLSGYLPRESGDERGHAMALSLTTAEEARHRIVVALDVDSKDRAIALVRELAGEVGLFKIGLELLSAEGPTIIDDVVREGGSVFVDPKLHDIPNTVRGAARALARHPVEMMTVHATGGRAMMEAAVEGVRLSGAPSASKPPKILAVTLLTSINGETLREELGVDREPLAQVVRLSLLAMSAGAAGVVASPNEVRAIRREIGVGPLIVTPGVRPTWAPSQDQKRVMTPGEAIAQGATLLVLGRPIISPPPQVGGPRDAVRLVRDEIAAAIEETRAG